MRNIKSWDCGLPIIESSDGQHVAICNDCRVNPDYLKTPKSIGYGRFILCSTHKGKLKQ